MEDYIRSLVPLKTKFTWQDYEKVKSRLQSEGIFGYEGFLATLMGL